jgi:hypothetical protein
VWDFFLPYNSLFPVYIHLLVVGWITLLILGIAYWMFPKYTRDLPRGSELLGWSSYILLNAGLALRVISEPLNALADAPGSLWGTLLAVAALLQWMGGMAFVTTPGPSKGKIICKTECWFVRAACLPATGHVRALLLPIRAQFRSSGASPVHRTAVMEWVQLAIEWHF